MRRRSLEASLNLGKGSYIGRLVVKAPNLIQRGLIRGIGLTKTLIKEGMALLNFVSDFVDI